MKKLINIGERLIDVIFTFLLVTGICLITVSLCGIKLMAVRTGSMGDSIPVGSLIFVKSCEASSIVVGDVITFTINEELETVTHRVIQIDLTEKIFITNGDANITGTTENVNFQNLVGKVILNVKNMGYIIFFLDTFAGKFFVMLVLSLLSILSIAGNSAQILLQRKVVDDEKN